MLNSLLERIAARRRRGGADTSPDPTSSGPRDRFFSAVEAFPATATVLEVGTKQAVAGTSTSHREHFHNIPRERYVMLDIQAGEDVDVVGDLHDLPAAWTDRFDAFIALAVFEHLERPWLAAREVARVLKPGGLCYVATHQTYPLHAHPSDFFRFSTDALSLIFADAGMRTIEVAYLYRAQIIPPRTIMARKNRAGWNEDYPSYLVVHLFAEKP